LENCIQAWSSYLQKDIHCLESVQQAATKLVPCFGNLSHEKRLQALDFGLHHYTTKDVGVISLRPTSYCLVLRRSQVISSSNYSSVITVQENTAGSFKSRGQDLIHGSVFFSQRVVQHWNSLSQSVVDAISVTSFKRHFDNCTRYEPCLPSSSMSNALSSSTPCWYQFFHFRLTYSFTRHFFLF